MQEDFFQREDNSIPTSEQEDGYVLETAFLTRLAENLRRPYTYAVPEAELEELKRIVLLSAVDLCDYLTGEMDKPVTYVSKGGYYVIQNGPSISLTTGRMFEGGGYETGKGDVIWLWRWFKGASFYEAIKGLTYWCLLLREKKERFLRHLKTPKVAINELKQIVWELFEDNGLVVGEKVLFLKGNGERTSWISARGLWKLLYASFGEGTRQSRYFAAPHGVREILDLWHDSQCLGRFEINRRWSPKGSYEKALKVEYSFVPTGYSLDFPLE
jgi:hypothetical protein